jgi:5'-hydroxyaverantin dehydrogenase
VAGFKAAVSFSPSKTIDIVLANAGITGKDPLEAWLDTELSSGDDPQPPSTLALDINLKGVYYTTRLSLFYFKKTVPAGDVAATSKHLIYVSSIAGYIGLNNTIEYNASKFGVRGLFKSIRHSTAILGGGAKFRANLIAPTFIKTDLTASIEPALKKRGFEMGTVQDVVAGVMRVACDEDICARAIAIAAGKHVAGDRNFDLCDDWEGFDGGKEMLENIRDSTLPHLETLAVEYSMRK